MHPFLEFSTFNKPLFDVATDSLETSAMVGGSGDEAIARYVQEAMNSLAFLPEDKEPVGEATNALEPSFSRVVGAKDPIGSGGSGSGPVIPRPKTNPYKEAEAATDSEDEYVVVNSAAVEVNAIADVLNRAPVIQIVDPKESSPTSIFSQSMMSESPPAGIGIQSVSQPPYSSSPTVTSALSKALALTTARFWYTNVTTPEEQGALDILASLSTLSNSASTDDERAIWSNVTSSARRAAAVVDLASFKLSKRSRSGAEAEEDTVYHGYVLYLKALSVIRVAMMHAKSFWQLKDQAITTSINQAVQYLRDKFNEYLEAADRLGPLLKKTKYEPDISTSRVYVDQARLLFDRARELGKEAGIEEVLGNNAICERHFTNGKS